MPVSDSDRFRWSTSEYTLKEISQDLREYTPFLVRVVRGHSSPKLELSSNKIFWVRDITKQTYVVAKNRLGCYFNIPECSTQQFVPLKRKHGGEYTPVDRLLTISELRYMDRYQFFQIADVSSEERIKDLKLGQLEIVDIYEEEFVVMHAFFVEDDPPDTGSKRSRFMAALHPQLTVVRAGVPVVVSIAEGLKIGSKQTYFKMMLSLKRFADVCDNNYANYIKHTAEILTCSVNPNKEDVYQYIDAIKISHKRNGQNKSKPTRDLSGLQTEKQSSTAFDGCQERSNRHCTEEHLKFLGEIYKVGLTALDTREKDIKLKSKSSDLPSLLALGGEHSDDKERSETRVLQPLPRRSSQSKPSPEPVKSRSDILKIKQKTKTDTISCLADIPSNVATLSGPMLMDCLRLLDMSQCILPLERHSVDGKLLCSLNETTLWEKYGISKVDARKLLHFCSGWRPILNFEKQNC